VTLLLRLVVLVKLLLVTESLGQLTPGGWCPPMMFVG
jgi:H+/Cl- antiporter ClcA